MTAPIACQKTKGLMYRLFCRNISKLLVVVLLLLIAALFWAIQKKSEFLAAVSTNAVLHQPLVNAVTLQLSPETIHERINLPGIIEPWFELELLAKINGMVEEVYVSEGDRIEKGQVIAMIEQAEYTIALAKARAAFALAKADHQRDRYIHAKGVIPTAELEARSTILKTAEADLEYAELQYSRCKITAPTAGVIDRLKAKVGLYLSVGDPIGTIIQTDRLKAVVGIPESDVSAVREIDEVTLEIEALDGEIVQVKKHFLSPRPSAATPLYDLELEVDNSDGSILPGMFFRADIVKRTVEGAVAAPLFSIISRNNQHFVFIEKDGMVEKRNIVLGIMDNWMVEVTAGLETGENLVVEGHRNVADSQPVRVVRTLTNPQELTL